MNNTVANDIVKAAESVVLYDPYAPGFDADPHPALRRLREMDPVHWWAAGRGWVVSRYEDVLACLRDPRLVTDPRLWEHAPPRQAGAPATEYETLMAHALLTLSDMAHARVRRLVAPAFTPSASAAWRGDVQDVVDGAIAHLGGSERADVVTDFAQRIPLRFIARMLRIPEEYDAAFLRYANAVGDLVASPWLGPEEIAARGAAVAEGVALLDTLIERRRAEPTNDLVGMLVRAEEQGDRLSTLELKALIASLVVAGSETTVHLITFGALSLLRHPQALEEVRRNPSLLPGAIEEVLRWDLFSLTGAIRFARESFSLRGREIRKGQMVTLQVTGAQRDPEVYSDPDRFDIRRDNRGGLAFGFGPHYCLGATLARIEAEIALRELLVERFPRIQLAGEPGFMPHPAARKMVSLPVHLGIR